MNKIEPRIGALLMNDVFKRMGYQRLCVYLGLARDVYLNNDLRHVLLPLSDHRQQLQISVYGRPWIQQTSLDGWVVISDGPNEAIDDG